MGEIFKIRLRTSDHVTFLHTLLENLKMCPRTMVSTHQKNLTCLAQFSDKMENKEKAN